MSKGQKGFTLVELLVVIAIIALLMSILMPALARVRNQAKNVLCQSNLRQWGICFGMYADDWEGSAPRGWWDGGSTPGPYNTDYWMEALRECYGNAHELRCCPTATKPGTEMGGGPYGGNGTFIAWGVFGGEDCGEPSTTWNVMTACDYGSYGMNAWICNPPPDAPMFESHNVALNNWRTFTIKGAGRVPLLGDEQWIDCWPDVTDAPPEFDGEPWGPYAQSMHMVRICLNRHSGYVNWVFMDYSVRPVGLKELWYLPWHKRYDFDLVPTNERLNAEAPWMRPFKSYD